MHEWSGLMIADVKNLKLVGEKGVRILSEDIYLDVLSFKDVQDVQISNIIAGHLTVENDGCAGGVFRFEESKNITVANCDLFGCGAEGFSLWNVDTFNFVNSVIRDCSLRIMTIDNSKNIIIKNSILKNCRFYELIYLYQSDNVKFISCEIIDNESDNYIFYNEESKNIELSKCKIVKNKSTFFGNYEGCVDIDGETTINPAQFSISMYDNENYDNYEGYINYDENEEYDSNWDSGLKTETVKTTSELYNAIGSNKIIKIKKGTYNFKNQALKFGGVANLKIIGENGVTIGIEDPYEMVISFFDSKNITIQNITAGHFVEKGACGGGVISLECCKNITIDKCDLFGSGTEGIIVINGNGINVTNSIIRECMYSFMYIDNAKNIVFDSTTFNKNETYYDLVNITNSNALFNKCTISNNRITEKNNYAMFNVDSSKVILNDSLVKNNETDYFEKIKGSVIIQGKTKFENNTFRKGMYEGE